jgi:hypothetical protein
MPPKASVSQLKRHRLIAMLAIVLIVAVTSCHRNAAGGELELTAATDPGANAFMPPAASPPPTNTQPPPTLQPQGNGNTLETQPLPGDRDGLYGGTTNNAEVDREKMITFFGANPPQANSFVEALNSDPTVYWSGGRRLVVADIPAYLRELTPAVLRLDTRITDHGFDGTHPNSLQSVFERGTALLVDAHGLPRVRGFSGNPLTVPVALRGAPKLVGTPWPGYRSGALAEVLAATTAITNFVLVDIVTGQAFNRPAGTNGTNDTPHTQPVASPGPAQATPTTGQTPRLEVAGTYKWHYLTYVTNGVDYVGTQYVPDTMSVTFTLQGNTLTELNGDAPFSGPLKADGSFTLSGKNGTVGGVFANEGGRTVVRDGVFDFHDITRGTWVATKQ